jgi:hypothetical protein
MRANHMTRRSKASSIFRRAIIEMTFILFLFYANLLMGQYNLGHSFANRSIVEACRNIFTIENAIIGVVAAFVGHVAFDHIRKRL